MLEHHVDVLQYVEHFLRDKAVIIVTYTKSSTKG